MKWLGVLVALAQGTLAVLAVPEVEARSMVRIGRDVVVDEGTAVGDAVAVGGNVTVNGLVEDSAVAVGGSVILGPRAVVRGDVVSVGGRIRKAEGAEIRGDIVEVAVPGLSSLVYWRAWSWALGVTTFVGLLALAVLLVVLVPGPVARVSAAVEQSPLKASGWGVLGFLAVIPVAVMLGLTVVGIPLIPVEGILVGSAVFVGYVAVAQLVGHRIGAAVKRPELGAVWATILGLVTLWVVGWVPVLGWLVRGVACVLGLGGVVQALVSGTRSRREARPA